uniref:GRIP and coiled-coil domain-containing protein 2-like n=1 Tax=Stegastes partitus TaxID=144197 RepID=A0A3B5AAR3_9TELE
TKDPGGTGAESVAPSPGGLDTLSKDDLIKFAKKQMAAMQKMKSKCAGSYEPYRNLCLTLPIVYKFLTERMDALLLEKAETQQSLAMSRKDLEKTKQQAKVKYNRCCYDISIEESQSKHQEEVAHFQKLLKEREVSDRERDSERERERQADSASAKESVEEVRRSLEAQLETLRGELQAIQERTSQEMVELQESHQRELTKAQQEVENLKGDLAQKSLQHEEEMRALEEDCEIERERLLLLHEELTEQLDVQEEDEDPARNSGIAKMLELSGCSQAESSPDDAEETETRRLKVTLDDLQAQNTMLQDELTLLTNVKGELDSELERVKEEFQMEREELEFKINEMQMTKDSALAEPAVTLGPDQQEVLGESKESVISAAQDQNSLNPEEQQKMNQELRSQCEALTRERDSALAECHHMRDILQSVETELGEKTKDFVEQYKAMKEQGANAVRDLHEKIEQLNQERDELLARVNSVTEEKNTWMEKEQTTLASELKQSVADLTRQNEEIISKLAMEENMTQDLKEMVNTLTEERDKTQNLLKLREEEIQTLNEERTKEIEKLQEEKDKKALLLREENEKELKNLKIETQNEVQHLKEQREQMEERLKEEIKRREETVSALEETTKELSTEKTDLHQKLEEASTGLSKAQEEKELLGSKLAALEAQLEQEASEKQHLEVKLNALTEEAEQARASIQALKEDHSEVLQKSTEEAEDLRTRVEELEKERSLLKRSLVETQGEGGSDEVLKEFQARISDLEQERDMLRANLEEVVKDTEGLQKDLQDMKSVNEKFSDENQNLQAQISLMTKSEEEKQEMEEESREFREQLTEKDSLISQLRSEMAALQVSRAPDVCLFYVEWKMAGLTTLEKESKEKDEKMNKIKAVAVKAKKELDNSKKEVATLKEEIESLKAEREKVSSSMKDIIHGAEGYKVRLTETEQDSWRFQTTRGNIFILSQMETLSSEKEDLLAGMETVRSAVRQLETKNQELQRQSASLDKELLAEKAIKEQKLKVEMKRDVLLEELTAQLRKQQQQSQQTAQELEQLRKEAQQSSLLDMEMADYERLVKELNAKLSEKDECAEELKTQINTLSQKEETLKEEIEALKSQMDQREEKTSKMKQLLVKTKKDLADSKKQESSLMMLQASLKGELEAHQQQLENSKIEVSELTAERQRLQEQLRSALEQQQRTSSSLQQRIHSLQQERDTAKDELVATTGEFESYKVRVHNVLKQQKSKTTTQSEGDAGKLEREQLSSQVEQLRTRLAESQQSLQSSTAELQQLQTEHDTLLERHNKILQETVSKEAELRERLLSLQSDNVALRSDLSQAQADLSSQVETQRQTYREQLRKLQDDHRATVETLQGQLTRVEEQLFNLQSQNSSVAVQSSRKPLASDPQRRNTDQNPVGLGLVALSDLQSMAREEGEGMETTETESSSPALTPLPSLEQLLTSPDPKQEPFVWTVEPTKEELSEKLSTATRSMEHMNSLLHETEATNAVLMEQITVCIYPHTNTKHNECCFLYYKNKCFTLL